MDVLGSDETLLGEEQLFALLMKDQLFVKRFITEFARGPEVRHARYSLGSAFRRFYERRDFGNHLERHELGTRDTNLGDELDIYLHLTLSAKGTRLRERIYEQVGSQNWNEIAKEGWYHYADAKLLSNHDIEILRRGIDVRGLSLRGWYEFFLLAADGDQIDRLNTFFPSLADAAMISDLDQPSIRLIRDERLVEAICRDPDRIFALTARQFEHLTAELLESLGYRDVTLGQSSKDGGVDVSAFIEHSVGTERIIVQCKHHAIGNKVGEPTIKQLYADTEIHRAARGLLITTSYLTRPANLLVETYKHRLSAIDHDRLMRLLKEGSAAWLRVEPDRNE
jgi:hypothetical protein